MRKYMYVTLMSIGLLAGVLAAFSSIVFVMALLGVAAFALILFLDFQRATYVLALYSVIDFALRNFIDNTFLASSWDELFFVLCFVLWLYKWFSSRKERPYSWTPLEFPLIIFFGVGIILLIVNSPDMKIGIEGLRQVIEYMLWFYVTVQLLRSEKGAKRLVSLLVMVGTGIALYGIFQYYAKVDVPTSWIDQAENSVGPRIFSIVVSPNILGSLMVLLIPLSVAFVYMEEKLSKKFLYIAFALVMTVCMLLTGSRSALVGLFIAALIFILLKDRRLLIPLIIVVAAAYLFVPVVHERISYLLSPDYIISSSKGGRLLRWPMGIELLKENLWTGVGLGRFGGAVASLNQIPDSFYMDNYYLKTAVEMGIFGVSAFILLMYNTLIWGIRAIKNVGERTSTLVQCAVAGMAGVVITNIFENIFEVPLMVTYFWMVAGVVMFLGFAQKERAL